MNSAFMKFAGRAVLALLFAGGLPGLTQAQDPQTTPTPMDEKARQRAEREARKAAEQEEKALKAAAEKERKEAEAATREREKAAARLAREAEKQRDAEASAPVTAPAPTEGTLTKEQERIQKAEEKARLESEKARQKEEERRLAQEAKDAERRRKDEERAQREAAKARDKEDKARAEALRKEQEESEKAARRAAAGLPPEPRPAQTSAESSLPRADAPGVPLTKEEEKRRRELVKQIEKARAERDRLNNEAEAAEQTARAARAAANDGQRNYEALATGLDVEDVAPVLTPVDDGQPKKNRFVTKADVREARAAPQAAPDPLRIALDLRNSDPEVRERAAFSLASLGPDAQPATRALMAAMTDANAAVRVAAAQALGRIGPGAALAFAPLTAALTDPDPAVKNAAQAALLAIQGGR